MKKQLLFLLTISAVLIFFSCKKSNVFGGIEPNTNRVMAEFTDARTGTHVSHDFSAEPVELDLTELRLEPRTVTNHSTTVKIIPNPVVVSQYNSANGTSYVPAGASTFSLTKNEFVLTPDKRKVMVRASVRPAAFLDAQYAIGLSIAEMSDGQISKIANNVIVFISIKNDYDGIYSIKGYSNIPSTPYIGNFIVPCSEELEVATSSANSVYIYPTQPVYSTGSFAYISNLLPNISFSKATNKVTAVDPMPGSLGFIFPYDAAYDSRYDPTTKTIYVKYGVAPAGSGRYIIDTLSFCKPR